MPSLNIYKSFDSSEFLFEILWKDFPSIVTVKDKDKFINKLIISSSQFCDLRLKNYFKIKYFSEGSFGAVGKIGVHDKAIKAAIFSFERSGRNDLFYTNTIIKVGKQVGKNKIYRKNISTISVSDPLCDMVFGSMLGHLYDIGVCPFVTKYFGTYLCSNNETNMIIEAADEELFTKLNRTRNGRLNASDLKNIITQYCYCLYVLKVYYGAVHFDSHLRNVMLKDVQSAEYMYHGKKFDTINYILLETGVYDKNSLPIIVMLKKTNYIVKLIDYGSMLVCLDRSHYKRFKRDLRISTDNEDISKIGAGDALRYADTTRSFANTVDVLFTLINIYEYLRHNLDGYHGIEHNHEHLRVTNDISYALFGFTLTKFLETHPEFLLKKLNGRYDWFMRNHNTGILTDFSEEKYLMEGIVKMCTKSVILRNFSFENTKYHKRKVNIFFMDELSAPEVPTSENSIFLTHNASDYNMMFNRFEKILKYTEDCGKYDNVYCNVEKLYKQVPSEKFLPNTSVVVQSNYNITTKMSSFDGNPKYKNYNSWLNSSPVGNERLNRPIENVRINLVEIKNYKSLSLHVNDPLVNTNGVSVPIGNSAVFKSKVLPLGFFANESPLQILQYLYPSDYNDYLAVVTCDRSGELNIEKLLQFNDRHIKVQKISYINKEVYETVDSVKTDPITLTRGNKYRWAVTVGPILVWDKLATFSEDQLTIESKDVLYGNSSNLIFKGNSPGYYGMTDSAEIQSQLILVKKGKRFGFILVEGGGFIAAGIDRPSAALLCKNLGMDFAVCIGSGYSTNVVISEKSNKKYLSKSPIRTGHGAVLNINF